MSETHARGGRRRPPSKTTLIGILLALDAIVALLPQVHWTAGSSRQASTALLYSAGGSVLVLASLMVMYAIGRPGSSNGEDPA